MLRYVLLSVHICVLPEWAKKTVNGQKNGSAAAQPLRRNDDIIDSDIWAGSTHTHTKQTQKSPLPIETILLIRIKWHVCPGGHIVHHYDMTERRGRKNVPLVYITKQTVVQTEMGEEKKWNQNRRSFPLAIVLRIAHSSVKWVHAFLRSHQITTFSARKRTPANDQQWAWCSIYPLRQRPRTEHGEWSCCTYYRDRRRWPMRSGVNNRLRFRQKCKLLIFNRKLGWLSVGVRRTRHDRPMLVPAHAIVSFSKKSHAIRLHRRIRIIFRWNRVIMMMMVVVLTMPT